MKIKGFEWFNLDSYESLATFDLNDWHQQLSIRRLMQELLTHSSSIPKTQKKLLAYAGKIKKQPIIDLKNDDSVAPNSISSVKGFSIMDMEYWINDDWFIEAESFLGKETLFSASADEHAFITKSVNLHLRENFPDEHQSYAYLCIDMNTPNAKIESDFKVWLKEYNAKVNKKKFMVREFKETELWDYCDQKVLPFIDIRFIAKLENISLTYKQYTDLLEFTDVDVVKKTTKKKADHLISLNTLYAMHNQLHQSE